MKRHLTLAALLLGASVLVGCSSTPKPEAELALSRQAVQSAVSAGGAEYAPVELKTAQDKLGNADAAMQAEEYAKARRLATEVTVDAKLAETTALAAKAQAALVEAQKGQRALQDEIGRQTTP